MDSISGYARVIAKTRAQSEQTKPFLGKPYLKYGQLFVLSGYCVQLGAVLASRHRDHLDEFGHAFLGATCQRGAALRYFEAEIESQLALISEPASFPSFVFASHRKTYVCEGDSSKFLREFGSFKFPIEAASDMAWRLATQGAVFGATRPELARRMYEQTHRERTAAELEWFRQLGLDIAAGQERMSWDELAKCEDELFKDYVEHCCPQHRHVLCR